MKNNLSDLKNYLFAQIERLDNEEMTDEELQKEVARTDALTNVSRQILDIGKLELSAIKHADNMGYSGARNGMSNLLGCEEGKGQ